MLKRIFDILIASSIIVSAFIPLLILAVIIRIRLGRPVLFIRERPGLNGKIFKMVKLRTMTDEKDQNGELLPDEKRLTKFGRFLRSSSLDELPELINVLKGDMSLIGPRPLLKEYLSLYNQEQTRRHDVRPGITGWAQVNGRNAISWDEKFKLDLWYVENKSFGLDLKILWLTLFKVVKSEGISQNGHVTAEKFRGN